MKSNEIVDQILYGDEIYALALPCLVGSIISETFDKLIERVVRRLVRHN